MQYFAPGLNPNAKNFLPTSQRYLQKLKSWKHFGNLIWTAICERKMSTYLGRGFAIPHARLEGIEKPLMILGRSSIGVPLPGRADRVHLFFILMTPAKLPRAQARLLARIGGMMDSEYVEERLMKAPTPQAILDTIRAGDRVA